VDFGDILKKWEKQTGRARGERGTSPALNGLLDMTEIYDKDAALEKERNAGLSSGTSLRGERRYRLLRKKPDDLIDLHGLNRDDAWNALEAFFENSRRNGCEKVLIIHGKGNHGTRAMYNAPLNEGLSEGALRDLSRRFVELCPFAGESGYSSAREGGTGATWVILKERK